MVVIGTYFGHGYRFSSGQCAVTAGLRRAWMDCLPSLSMPWLRDGSSANCPVAAFSTNGSRHHTRLVTGTIGATGCLTEAQDAILFVETVTPTPAPESSRPLGRGRDADVGMVEWRVDAQTFDPRPMLDMVSFKTGAVQQLVHCRASSGSSEGLTPRLAGFCPHQRGSDARYSVGLL